MGPEWEKGPRQAEGRWVGEVSASEPAVMETVWEKSDSIPGKNLAVTAPQKWCFKCGCISSRAKS